MPGCVWGRQAGEHTRNITGDEGTEQSLVVLTALCYLVNQWSHTVAQLAENNAIIHETNYA